MKKQISKVTLMMALTMSFSAYAAGSDSAQPQSAKDSSAQPSVAPVSPTGPAPAAPSGSGCAQLSPEEATFAGQLADMNLKNAFCTQLTADQRRQVMGLMAQPDASGKMLTADQAMQKFMTNNNMAVPNANPGTMPPRRSSSGGACPVK